MSKTVPFQTIQFSIRMQFSSIWPRHRTLSGATTPDQSRPGSDGKESVLRIPQSSSITGKSSSDCLVVISRTLQRCCRCILQPQLTEQQSVVLIVILSTSKTKRKFWNWWKSYMDEPQEPHGVGEPWIGDP